MIPHSERTTLVFLIVCILLIVGICLFAPGCSPHEMDVAFKAGLAGKGVHYSVGYARCLDELEGRKGGLPAGWGQVNEEKMLQDPSYWQGRNDALAGLPVGGK